MRIFNKFPSYIFLRVLCRESILCVTLYLIASAITCTCRAHSSCLMSLRKLFTVLFSTPAFNISDLRCSER